MHHDRKISPPTPPLQLIYWCRKFVLATLVEDHKMTIYSNQQSNLSISFCGEDFQRINKHYNWKNHPTCVGASIIDQASLFKQLWMKGHQMIIYANLQSNLSTQFWEKDFQRSNIHYSRNKAPPPPPHRALIYWRKKLVFAILAEDH